jgi:hypothetical protein
MREAALLGDDGGAARRVLVRIEPSRLVIAGSSPALTEERWTTAEGAVAHSSNSARRMSP